MANCVLTGSPVVDAVGKMNITGNVIPIIWYKTITNPNGKPNLNAITILSDIVYWYRPTYIRDEDTGEIIGCRKKFKNEMLKRSYSGFERLFGLSKKQTRDALIILEGIGVVKRVFLEEELGSDSMYIELDPDVLRILTYPEEQTKNADKQDNVIPPLQNCNTPVTKKSHPHDKKITPSIDTVNNINTIENNKEISKENISVPSSAVSLNKQRVFPRMKTDDDKDDDRMDAAHDDAYDDMTEIVKSRVDYERMIKKSPYAKSFFDKCVEIMAEVYGLDDSLSSKIGLNNVNNKFLKEKLFKITGEDILNIYKSIIGTSKNIRNEKAYILSCLFNESGKSSPREERLKRIQGSFYFKNRHNYDYDELERMLLDRGG